LTTGNLQTLSPATEEEAAALVVDARARRGRLGIVGGGTRSGLGRPIEVDAMLSTSALIGFVFHEPAEMVFCARAGTSVAAIEAQLAQHGQILPFEPMDHRAIYAIAGEPTIGAVAAANISGPRRISAGAARDSLIGVRLVNGLGEIVKAGGRVAKNVTGLDLVKLVSGAYGGLGLIAEATFKVLPKPERAATIVIRRLDDARGIAALSDALGSPWGVSGAAHISAGMGREFPRTLLRVEGFADSVEDRIKRLLELLAPYGAKHALEGEDSTKLWRAIRDAEFLAEPRESALWRVSLAPSKGPRFVAALGDVRRAHFYDWGGGLVWLATEASAAAAAAVRGSLASFGGHATLVRAPDELRRSVDVFEPLTAPLRKITQGIKASFDPDGVFNPGRMYESI
jgi:glycolate oxidase FAD binding subunit